MTHSKTDVACSIGKSDDTGCRSAPRVRYARAQCPSCTPVSMTADLASDATQRQQLIAALVRALPADALLHRKPDLKPYECDGLTAFRQLPLAVALPRTIGEVQAVLRICNEQGVPVVARGAGTGLSGGALPLENGVVLGLARLNRIIEIDPRKPLRARAAGRHQPGDLEGGRAVRLVLRARPVLADRLHDRRQCRRERWRAALPEVRFDHAQPCSSSTSSRSTANASCSAAMRWMRRATTCSRCSPDRRACSASSSRSPSNCCRSRTARVCCWLHLRQSTPLRPRSAR